MRRGKRKQSQITRMRINEAIRARELRIIDDEKGNLGVMSAEEALKLAQEAGLDLIEISPEAKPPVAKIMDYGKFQYTQKKKDRDVRAKARAAAVEVKEVQIKPGTGEHDVATKANRASKWIADGQRVKVEIFLRGREKYQDASLHEERINGFLTHITEAYTIADPFKKVPKGYALIIERDRSAKKKEKTAPNEEVNSEQDKESKEENHD